MSQTDILPFIHVQGSWGEMGHTVGRMLEPAIARHAETWIRHITAETGAARAEVLGAAAGFQRPIQEHAGFLWEELDGMARGASIPAGELLVLQARAEVLRALRDRRGRPAPAEPECTTFAVGGRRTAGGGVLFGQNVDLVPFVEEFGAVVRQYPKDAPAALLYTSAGLLGHNGLNEAGVGICANFVDDPSGWGYGVPRYLLSRLALREGTAEAALKAALAPPRAASRNLLVADQGGTFVDAECLRHRVGVIQGADDMLVHANHLESAELSALEAPAENSLRRRRRLQHLIESSAAPLTVEQLQGFYRDHADAPHSLCAHPFAGRNIKTVVSVIGDLTARELHAAKGSPCRTRYATYTLATCQTGALSVTVRDSFAVPAS
ncbi:MAG TPA: C45 family peptidase [Candidatus Methylomirabilis sp.]|nr:C45 family peptidase [Candidatus Methylomirabilis sp.]